MASRRRGRGGLERDVLALLAAREAALTPAEVRDALDATLAYTTVTTVLARLHTKGLVSRKGAGRGYAYQAVSDHAVTARGGCSTCSPPGVTVPGCWPGSSTRSARTTSGCCASCSTPTRGHGDRGGGDGAGRAHPRATARGAGPRTGAPACSPHLVADGRRPRRRGQPAAAADRGHRRLRHRSATQPRRAGSSGGFCCSTHGISSIAAAAKTTPAAKCCTALVSFAPAAARTPLSAAAATGISV